MNLAGVGSRLAPGVPHGPATHVGSASMVEFEPPFNPIQEVRRAQE